MILNVAVALEGINLKGTASEAECAPARLPRNWYMLATSAEVTPGVIVARKIAGRDIVLFRTTDGAVAAFAGHCAHMGCHLRHGAVVDGHLRCALHFRSIAADGRFLRPEGRPSDNLRQPSYPVEERFGGVFIYIGGGAPTPFPEPDLAPPDSFLAAPAGQLAITTPWYALIANGFDMEHLLAVHSRTLREPPVVSRPDENSFRLGYRTMVTGRGISDRIMRWVSNNDIHASMTTIGGSMMLVQSMAGPRPSFFLLSLCPDENGGTLVRAIGGLQGRRSNLIDRCKLAIALPFFFIIPALPIPVPDAPAGSAMWLADIVNLHFNYLPSLHVAFAISCAVVLTRMHHPLASLALWLLAGMVVASTMLTKQHYLMDVVAGAVLAIAAMRVVYPQLLSRAI